jgi:putative acetyltransferase
VIDIREEHAGDVSEIRELNQHAFGQSQEGNIVDALRANGGVLLSLVATLHGHVVGHILYTPLSVSGVDGAALGPMAVLPQHQRQGIGSELVEAGNRRLKGSGCPFIIVVGHANFYPRFGFKPGNTCGITCGWEVPDEAFMVLTLDHARMAGVSGLAQYRPEFSTIS